MLTPEALKAIRERAMPFVFTSNGKSEDTIWYAKADVEALLSHIEELGAKQRDGVDKIVARMCELDTPKRGELHGLLIQLFT